VDLDDSKNCVSSTKKEEICLICEEASLGVGVVQCRGLCQSSFHTTCLGLTVPPSEFTCSECTTGRVRDYWESKSITVIITTLRFG